MASCLGTKGGGARPPKPGWWLLTGEVPHGLPFFSAFHPEVEHARDHTDSQERGGPRAGGGSEGAGARAALRRDLAGAEEWAARDPRKSSKGKHPAAAQRWADAPQEVGPGGGRAAVAMGKALEARVPRQQGQSRSLACASKGAGGTAGKGSSATGPRGGRAQARQRHGQRLRALGLEKREHRGSPALPTSKGLAGTHLSPETDQAQMSIGGKL